MVDALGFWAHVSTSKAELDAAIAAGLQAADRDRILAIFGAAFDRFAPGLNFEFGVHHDGNFEFIISAGGIQKNIAAVQKLRAAAPKFDRWRVIAFKPRHSLDFQIQFGNQTCDLAQTRCSWTEGGDRLNIIVYPDVPPNTDKNVVGQIAFLALDVAIGEYDVMTRIGTVASKSLPRAADRMQLATMAQFVAHFDRYFSPLRSH